MERTYKHLTYSQRTQIKAMLDEGYKKTEIAAALGFDDSTIYREVARGSKNGQYDPAYSEIRYKAHLSAKGADPMLTIDLELAQYISKAILEEQLSPAQISKRLQNEERFRSLPKSINTIYNAIDKGMIPGVTRDSLNSNVTTVFSDGQIHIAKWVRESLKISDGDKLYFDVVEDKLIFTKIHNNE